MYGTEVNVPMLDDGLHGDGVAGDGVYGGTIPASASTPGQMVRYFIAARDVSGDASRQPLYQVPSRSALCHMNVPSGARAYSVPEVK